MPHLQDEIAWDVIERQWNVEMDISEYAVNLGISETDARRRVINQLALYAMSAPMADIAIMGSVGSKPQPSERDREMAAQIFADPVRAHEVAMLLACARAEGRHEAVEECARIADDQARLSDEGDDPAAVGACRITARRIRTLTEDDKENAPTKE